MQCLVKVADNSLEAKTELIEIERELSVQKCVHNELMINQKSQKKEHISAIFVLIKRFCNLVNVKGNLNEDQQIQLAWDIYERFSCESLEDVVLFFKMARSGEFGDFFRLDTVVILKWVDAYMDKKTQAFEDEVRNQENIRRRVENDAVANHVPDEKAKENLKKLSEMLKSAGKPTSAINRENPLFNLDAYCEKLQNDVGKMSDEMLNTMFKNTAKSSHQKVWEILNTEIELRKILEKNKKNNVKKKIEK